MKRYCHPWDRERKKERKERWNWRERERRKKRGGGHCYWGVCLAIKWWDLDLHVEFAIGAEWRESFVAVFSGFFFFSMLVPTTEPTRNTEPTCPPTCRDCDSDDPTCCTACPEGFTPCSCECVGEWLVTSGIVAISPHVLSWKSSFLSPLIAWVLLLQKKKTTGDRLRHRRLQVRSNFLVLVCPCCAYLLWTLMEVVWD